MAFPAARFFFYVDLFYSFDTFMISKQLTNYFYRGFIVFFCSFATLVCLVPQERSTTFVVAIELISLMQWQVFFVSYNFILFSQHSFCIFSEPFVSKKRFNQCSRVCISLDIDFPHIVEIQLIFFVFFSGIPIIFFSILLLVYIFSLSYLVINGA